MRLLPTQQATAVKEAIQRFEQEGALTIYEPCNCGSQVRHSNGGNYHKIIYLQKDGTQTFIKWDTTCELTASAEWEETSDPIRVIRSNADWL